MGVLWRAVLVGAAIGVVQLFIRLNGPEDDWTATVTLFFAAFPVGLALGWLVRLPRWWVVGILAPFVNTAILVVAFAGQTLFYVEDLGMRAMSFAFVGIGVGGHVTAAAVVVAGNRTLRALAVGAVFAGCVATSWSQDAIAEAARVRRLTYAGLPLIAPAMPDYRPTHLNEWFDEFLLGPPSFELEYEHVRDRSAFEVFVMSTRATSPQASCAEPVPDVTNRLGVTGTCRQVSPDVWVRREPYYIRVFARYGDALVQIASDNTPEADLLAVLPTFRPATAEELAAIGEI
ncbi:hypothetical protein Skr01_51650 [Sphaerisporangium krabiense]|uniref:Uncharacterized protein n=1 Tax=Sphaerisporangium krabiense TaxID=763782 RepID=A0A7W9DU59_9ACTN|nr:hypothetical protein [Sphaerisporangium krabiense]MBB5630130.1 hypothetical protein [Sphaerisporangium krabiense]GII65080.1 hypothetical protein Skr01_51650 [Sphaerisporangium krabiense]